jgi:hypothetical protein
VIADADEAVRQKEIPLRVDIDENLSPLRPDHVHHHPVPTFPGASDPTKRGYA